jgi:chromosome segregation ATPase
MANTPEFIADVQARIRSFENSYEEHMATHHAQQADLERLREAHTKLQSHLEEMDTLKTNLTSAQTLLTSSQFKGTRRNKFDDKLKAVEKSLKADQKNLENDKADVAAKIQGLELELSVVGDTMASIQATIQSLWNVL